MDETILHPTPADIMIVDDTPLNLSLLTRILHRRGHEVRAFTHGAQALESACTHPPDLILLDVNLRLGSGIELARQMRSDPELKDMRLIMTSGLDLKHECLQVGADNFLLKPYMPDDLIKMIKKYNWK